MSILSLIILTFVSEDQIAGRIYPPTTSGAQGYFFNDEIPVGINFQHIFCARADFNSEGESLWVGVTTDGQIVGNHDLGDVSNAIPADLKFVEAYGSLQKGGGLLDDGRIFWWVWSNNTLTTGFSEDRFLECAYDYDHGHLVGITEGGVIAYVGAEFLTSNLPQPPPGTNFISITTGWYDWYAAITEDGVLRFWGNGLPESIGDLDGSVRSWKKIITRGNGLAGLTKTTGAVNMIPTDTDNPLQAYEGFVDIAGPGAQEPIFALRGDGTLFSGIRRGDAGPVVQTYPGTFESITDTYAGSRLYIYGIRNGPVSTVVVDNENIKEVYNNQSDSDGVTYYQLQPGVYDITSSMLDSGRNVHLVGDDPETCIVNILSSNNRHKLSIENCSVNMQDLTLNSHLYLNDCHIDLGSIYQGSDLANGSTLLFENCEVQSTEGSSINWRGSVQFINCEFVESAPSFYGSGSLKLTNCNLPTSQDFGTDTFVDISKIDSSSNAVVDLYMSPFVGATGITGTLVKCQDSMDLRLQNIDASVCDAVQGGVVWVSDADLFLDSVSIDSCFALEGSAIYAVDADVNIWDSVISRSEFPHAIYLRTSLVTAQGNCFVDQESSWFPGDGSIILAADNYFCSSNPSFNNSFIVDLGGNVVTDDCSEFDCNQDGIPDSCQSLADCNKDGLPDECQSLPDCDEDGIPDQCQAFSDCNNNQVPDLCEDFQDCNGNGAPDECDLVDNDCDLNGIPDECQPDCDFDGVPNPCDDPCDSDGDGIPDECDVDQTDGVDCNLNGIDDTCELDCDSDGLIDICDNDDDNDGIPDPCDASSCGKEGPDCDSDGLIDFCESDCNFDGVPDDCQDLIDCDGNGVPDECQSTGDGDGDGIPDVCDPDDDGDGIPDECDIDTTGGSDCDANGVDDTCQEDSDGDGTIDPCDDDDDCGILGCDSDGDGILDKCDIDETGGFDCDLNGVDDLCQEDTDGDGTIDPCDPDDDGDGIPDECDIDLTGGADCNVNGQDDLCEPDCDADGLIDPCDSDRDGDGIPDDCDASGCGLEGIDCDGNGVLDVCDPDCDGDGSPDACDDDDDNDGLPDECDSDSCGLFQDDCQSDGIADVCQLEGNDCNANGVPDDCEAIDPDQDCNLNGIPDICDPDNSGDPGQPAPFPSLPGCTPNGIPDDCDDCNQNGFPDVWDLDPDTFPVSFDCNGNCVPDECDIASGFSEDIDGNAQPDECQPDCNNDGIPESEQCPFDPSGQQPCSISPFSPCLQDCNQNGIPDCCDAIDNNNDSNDDWIPDECQTNDCNQNGVDDAIDIAEGFPDCNENGIIDICDVASGSFEDCNDNLVPDVCEPSDCNANDIQDSCEIEQDPTRDANGNGILDECENPCPEDLDLSGTVDFADLLLLLGSYGPCLPGEPCPADVDQSGEVDFADLLSVLGAWGDACTP